MFGLTGMMSETVNADVDLQVTSMTTSKYVRDYVMKRCSVGLDVTKTLGYTGVQWGSILYLKIKKIRLMWLD